MKHEKQYEFRKRISQLHKKDIRDKFLAPECDEIVIPDLCTIAIDKNASDVIYTAVKDFCDYLFVSMNISSIILNDLDAQADIYINKCNVSTNSGEYCIEINDKITISASDDRSCARSLYYLEDLMSTRKAPYIKRATIKRKNRFSPRMVHSGFGLDEYPDEYLSFIAHSGRDAILVFAKEANITPYGYLDFNDLIDRASKYGIDVYAYSYIKLTMHPDEKGAEDVYDATYGELFKKCPGLKGIVLVGESVEFESKDEHVGLCGPLPTDALPTGKPRPGWWPCNDYPQWINLVKNTIRKYKSDADVVFWTYNWGRVEEKYRINLIESLPTDISLLVTYEMFEPVVREGITDSSSDYTIAFEGPGSYFVSEAKVAAKKGIRLYAMTNTAGSTWDFGVVPYIPVPMQWIKRYSGILQANHDWNLCGLMEGHHYGFYPSFLAELSGRVFDIGADRPEEELKKSLCKYYGPESADAVYLALNKWSDAICYHTMSNEDQYGPWRVGPAYPFVFKRKVDIPCVPYALWGNAICYTDYPSYPKNDTPNYTAPVFRYPKDIEFLTKERNLFLEGIRILEKVKKKSEELMYLLNMGRYIVCMITTGINIKKWYIEKTKLLLVNDIKEADECFSTLISIAKDEMQNAQSAIEYVKYDSRLGWEPSMEYIGGEDNIKWKIAHLKYVLDKEIPALKKQYNM